MADEQTFIDETFRGEAQGGFYYFIHKWLLF